MTLLELLVVVLIISILSTIAVGVYTGAVERARVAGAHAEVRQIAVAVERYYLDVGQYPPSSTGTVFPSDPASTDELDPNIDGIGCGYMVLALQHSLSGNANAPLDARWRGPYLNLDREQLGFITEDGLVGNDLTGVLPSQVQMLDPWGTPYRFLRFDDYEIMGGAELPVGHPFQLTETFYNPSTHQIVSNGPNRTTLESPEVGLDTDDVTNFTR
jgi:type II secretory pathway pseudopilin PulG